MGHGDDTPAPEEVTNLLDRAGRGDANALHELLPLVYAQLRASAAKKMSRERSDHTLQPTALVHEAYLRLVGDGSTSWESRGHFYAAAAEAMRRILIEHARARGRHKRGGDWRRVTLDSMELRGDPAPIEDIVSVDAAIRRMEERDPRMARIVRLRFFAGLSVQEIAQSLGITDRTVRREWATARAWLYRDLSEQDAPGTHDPTTPDPQPTEQVMTGTWERSTTTDSSSGAPQRTSTRRGFFARRVEAADATADVYALGGVFTDSKDAYAFLDRFRLDVAARRGPIVVDLAAVTQMTSCGVGILAAAYTSTLSAGRAMALAGMRPRVLSVMRVVGLLAVIPHYETCPQALAAAPFRTRGAR